MLLSFLPGLGRPGFFIGLKFGAVGREKLRVVPGAFIFVALVNQKKINIVEKGIINCDICEGEGVFFTPDLLEKGDVVVILSRTPSSDFAEGVAVKVRRITDKRETEINPSMVSPFV